MSSTYAVVSTAQKDGVRTLHCPFEWKNLNADSNFLLKTKTKLEELGKSNELLTCWARFILNLILCYEFFKMGKCSKSFSALAECEEALMKAKELYSQEPKMCVMGKGLEHITMSCNYYLTQSNNKLKAKKLLETIPSIQSLTHQEQASIWVVRAAVEMEYGSDGHEHAIQSAKEALKLESNCGALHFILAKALLNVQENESGFSSIVEITSFEKSVQQNNSVHDMEQLIQSFKHYCEFSAKHKVCTLCQTSVPFRVMLKERTHQKYINIRCADGFVMLPKDFKDIKLAGRCIEEALQKAPENIMVNHVAGIYYLKVNDLSKAKRYLMKAGEGGAFQAYLELFGIKLRENPHYNPTADLERLLERFLKRHEVDIILSELGIFAYKINKNFDKAMEYWSRIICENPESEVLKSFRSIQVKEFKILSIINENVTVDSKWYPLISSYLYKYGGT